MKKEKIVVIGGGGHAKVIISILKKIDKYEIKGYTDLTDNESILGVPYLGSDEILLNLFQNGITNAVIGLGQVKFSNQRKKIAKMLKEFGFNTPALVSPSSIINENVKIGKGSAVMDGVVINVNSSIGEFSILNTLSSVDHDCRIGDFTHLAPGAVLSGEVCLGSNILIGTGANVIQGISIIDNTLISAGSSVHRNITKAGIYGGVPAKFIREIT